MGIQRHAIDGSGAVVGKRRRQAQANTQYIISSYSTRREGSAQRFGAGASATTAACAPMAPATNSSHQQLKLRLRLCESRARLAMCQRHSALQLDLADFVQPLHAKHQRAVGHLVSRAVHLWQERAGRVHGLMPSLHAAQGCAKTRGLS